MLGSLYILLAADLDAVEEETQHAPYSKQRHSHSSEGIGLGLNNFGASAHSIVRPASIHSRQSFLEETRQATDKNIPTSSHHSPPLTPIKRSWTLDQTGKRREVAKVLTTIGTYLGTAKEGTFDDSEFQQGESANYPELPGERQRNSNLGRITSQYNQVRNSEGELIPRPASRASFAGSTTSARHGDDGGSVMPEEHSPVSTSPRRPNITTLLENGGSFDLQDPTVSPGGITMRPRQRRDTLEVPTQLHHQRSNSSPSFASSITTPQDGQISPSIIISSDPESTFLDK